MLEIHDKIREKLSKAYDKYSHQYNLRAREVLYKPGDIVLVRNFPQSNAGKYFSAKLAPKFIKGTITKRIGNVNYEVVDIDGSILGIYHAKDNKT